MKKKEFFKNKYQYVQFYCSFIKKGKKNLALKIFLDIILFLKDTFYKNPYFVFDRGIKYLKPNINILVYKKGRRKFKLPRFINHNRNQKLALNWLLIDKKSKRNVIKNTSIKLIETFDKYGIGMQIREKFQKTLYEERNQWFRLKWIK